MPAKSVWVKSMIHKETRDEVQLNQIKAKRKDLLSNRRSRTLSTMDSILNSSTVHQPNPKLMNVANWCQIPEK